MSKQTIHVGAMNSYEKASQASEYLRLSKLAKGEEALLEQLKALVFTQYWSALAIGIPLDIDLDTLDFASTRPLDRAAVTIYHGDGTATAIEVKDGSRGKRHVLAGIGQVGAYAVFIGQHLPLSLVRRALLWSSTADSAADGEIGSACAKAGVIAMPWRSLESMCAGRDAVIASLEF